MYSKTITLFNRYQSRLGDTWYPTVLRGVNLNIDKASIIKNYGAESQDNAILNAKYVKVGDIKLIDGVPYLPPKEWDALTNDSLGGAITFTSGQYFDFFIVGDYGSTDAIADDDYTDGFYNYIKKEYDYVFAITSVSEMDLIPHFEITGK